MLVTNFVWIVVTLLTDKEAAFYRKAYVFKRRIREEVEKQRLNRDDTSFRKQLRSQSFANFIRYENLQNKGTVDDGEQIQVLENSNLNMTGLFYNSGE